MICNRTLYHWAMCAYDSTQWGLNSWPFEHCQFHLGANNGHIQLYKHLILLSRWRTKCHDVQTHMEECGICRQELSIVRRIVGECFRCHGEAVSLLGQPVTEQLSNWAILEIFCGSHLLFGLHEFVPNQTQNDEPYYSSFAWYISKEHVISFGEASGVFLWYLTPFLCVCFGCVTLYLCPS